MFNSFDGAAIAYRVLGEGRPTLLLHGFLADAERNWIAPGIAGKIAAAGRQVILPDLRGHGRSEAPTDPARYPLDVLSLDQEALLERLGVGDYDLVGYSLGARTAVRMLARGARPGRVALGGMGDAGVTNVEARRAYFEDLIINGSASRNPPAAAVARAMMAATGMPQTAALGVLGSQISTPAETLAKIDAPILVVAGAADRDNGSAEGLAALFPNAKAVRVPGTHLSAVSEPALADAIIAFLNA